MNNKLTKLKERMTLNPIMTFVILILITIVLSGILSVLDVQATYQRINSNTGEYENVLVSVHNLFSLSGLKYIFSNTVSNFVNFVPLSSLIIILIGIGVMESSGFLKTAFTLLTKVMKKNTVTFLVALLGIVGSIMGDIAYVILIPLSALLYKYGKRNPMQGIITSFAGLACGSGLNLIANSVDTSLISKTLLGSHVLDANYTISIWSFVFIMIVAIVGLAFLITYISEKITSLKLDRYEFNKEELEEPITKKDLKGLGFALVAGGIYLFIFIWNIIPGLPLGGALLDYSQGFYIDKLFSYNSFFSMGFVFIVTMLFIILGLVYGIVSKTIKNNHDFCECLGHSLDKVGRILVLILLSSLLISVFKQTEIGTVIVAGFANLISGISWTGLPLIILLFIIGSIVTIFVPTSLTKWTILSGVLVPVAMNAGISPEFSQVLFRFSESWVVGLTPLFAYFVIYLSFIEQYNQQKKPISLFTSVRYMVPYSLATGIFLFVLIIAWYLIGLPIGVGTYAVL